MASLEIDPASGRYRVRFRYSGQEYKRSLRTKSRPVAAASLGQVEEALRMIEMGLVELPPDVEEGAFIVSGARVRKARRQPSKVQTLDDLFRVYQAELTPGSKEPRTLAGERLHFKHLLRHLKPKTRLAAITPRTVQGYVELRSRDQYAKRSITPDTIKKEITTLRLVWNWAKRQEYVENPPPISHVIYPKRDEKPPFQILAEIQRAVSGGKLSKAQEAALWESLFLTRPEVDRLLDHASKQAGLPFVYPMFVLVAHTGMRRSELLRAEKADFDFEGRTILVREKKRSRKHSLSFRRVPMTNLLGRVFKRYFAEHPSGPYALTRDNDQPLTTDAADHFFEVALKDSAWQAVRGFHVFRHSFASNAMAEGIDQRMIDAWMGHQTEEMRQRYRHLAPTQQQAAIDAVYRDEAS
ncbi:tyrosine-type recombinase/integrase [Botrimarina hoheduenensis]|uniref:Site-specific tyrosine recombinase XerC n=1 Tax=Botrimarina hoheduenensis TaxID=2528000 RepID=A0A5C5W9T4_9BACT|nr:tyrosine-type recombinase/integrase [Botrimarina hoheduenensis]TWT46392.1 site-specific tyrosine recombinase XerC [Botrimarina hoheduenensis]